MASSSFEMVLFAWLAAMLFIGASAQSSSCTSALISLSPCLNYITGNETTPTSSCCTQLSTVVKSEPQCLCVVLSGGASSSMGITVNQTQALALPGACSVQTPPVSKCDGKSGSPSSAPSTPSADGGSKTTPGTVPSDGSSVNMPFFLIFSLLFISSASSSTTLAAL